MSIPSFTFHNLPTFWPLEKSDGKIIRMKIVDILCPLSYTSYPNGLQTDLVHSRNILIPI